MNKISFWLSIVAFIMGVFSMVKILSATSDFAYVDVNVLFKEYERTGVLEKELEKKLENIKSNVDSLQQGWQNELIAFEKERISLTKKEIELKKQILGSKQQQLNNFQHAAELKMQEEEQKMTQTVLNDINDLVEEFGEKNNYQIIHGATGGGNLMYAKDALNITDEVLMELNTQYKNR